jgi:type 1 glutamine amidotransferase
VDVTAQDRDGELAKRKGLGGRIALAAFASALACATACDGTSSTSSPPADAGRAGEPDARPTAPQDPPYTGPLRVLFFTRENEWKHPSNPVAEAAMVERGLSRGWIARATRHSADFAGALAETDVVVFLVTSGILLDAGQRATFEAWVRAGHGVVGVHSASYTDVDWPFMRELVGATFKGHPLVMPGTVTVDAPADPVVAHLPRPWIRTDEWYTFITRPEENPALTILLSLDELATLPDYPGPGQPSWLRVGRHPLTWRQEYAGTRSFYTALGHTEESYREEPFVVMLEQAITWAGRR